MFKLLCWYQTSLSWNLDFLLDAKFDFQSTSGLDFVFFLWLESRVVCLKHTFSEFLSASLSTLSTFFRMNLQIFIFLFFPSQFLSSPGNEVFLCDFCKLCVCTSCFSIRHLYYLQSGSVGVFMPSVSHSGSQMKSTSICLEQWACRAPPRRERGGVSSVLICSLCERPLHGAEGCMERCCRALLHFNCATFGWHPS